MQSIAETCVRFDAAHLSINLVSEIAVPMFPTLSNRGVVSPVMQRSHHKLAIASAIFWCHGYCLYRLKMRMDYVLLYNNVQIG